jgi:hypothetical protein
MKPGSSLCAWRKSGLFFLIVSAIGVGAPAVAHANVSEWVSARLEFEYEMEPPATFVDAQLFYCDDVECGTAHPMQDKDPTSELRCAQDGCNVLLHRDGWRFKLVAEFEDRTRESNVFERLDRNGHYRVLVTETGLQVTAIEETRSFLRRLRDGGFAFALLITLLVEVVVADAYRVHVPYPRYLGWVMLASVLTLPVVWWIGLGVRDYVAGLALAETFAVVFEAGFIYFVFRKALTFRQSSFLSLIMNAASFLVGLVIGYVISVS